MKHHFSTFVLAATLLLSINCNPVCAVTTTQESSASVTCDTMDAYEDYIARFSDRSEFYTYEIIAALGALHFQRFTHFSSEGDTDGKCTDYAYDLITASDQILTFHVSPGEPNPHSDTVVSSGFSNTRDLRTNTGVTGWRAIKDIFYYYDNGILKTIQLSVGNNTILLTMPEGFSDYPLNDPTLPSSDMISNLLSDSSVLTGRYTFCEYLSAAPQRAGGLDSWKAQQKILLERCGQFLSRNSYLKNLGLGPFSESLMHYVMNPQWYEGLNADVSLEDFLFFETGITTPEELHQQVGAPHMTCANAVSSITPEVYLTNDGYCIIFHFGLDNSPAVHASIQHVDWPEPREYETVRQELLQQSSKPEPVRKTAPDILWCILGITGIVCAIVADIFFRKPKNKD